MGRYTGIEDPWEAVMSLDGALDDVEAQAEQDLPGAMAALEALVPGRPPAEAARIFVLLGALTARSGDLDGALPILERARVLGGLDRTRPTHVEAQITHASVLGALGRFDEAIPMLTRVIRELEGQPDHAELRRDAQAELRGYRNVVSPKTAATWASLLG